ncbi:metalloendopeptidase-like membrane protein [Desulfosporosinus acidiphilus SJ4]|uniref:Metalloendopeptidase-like membrane protein n=1 Tax=Desulfosporosinus acidiphilus (strain DSM 22704 / JCM 16185 / SJ4) TaxID=646529 RepID=I4DCA8_DESAJ|nr:peptidoglycan DD-metalloendopeptidase family protein [Desulfosporosinus acidiphilus]AFM43432.1 metalloendopeptidase-like membrane protein [Desulfosporosinus acidiphilus SJ4]
MFKKKVVLITALSLALLIASKAPSQASELYDAVHEQQSISSQKNQAQNKLHQLTYTSDKLKAQLAQLETQISAAQSLLAEKQRAFNQTQTQVQAAQKELDQKQQELADRRTALGKRARGIYENGQISYFELLFQSANLSDFITRMEYFNKLITNDQKLLTDIQEQKEKIAQKTQELTVKRNQAAQLQAQAAKAKTDLDAKKAQQQTALEQNQKAVQASYDEVERLQTEANALNDKIRKLQAAQAGRNNGNGTISTWPLPGHYEISDPYGWRTHPITHKQSLHTGTDIMAPMGTEIHAAGSGVVIMAGWNVAYGNMVIIDHGHGISSLYGHQSKLNVTEGQSVEANQVIGYVGSTGWSTGPHLHFEVRVDGNPTDPLQFFPN